MCIARQSCHPSRYVVVGSELLDMGQLWGSNFDSLPSWSHKADRHKCSMQQLFQWVSWYLIGLLLPHGQCPSIFFPSTFLTLSLPSSHTHTQYTNSPTSSDHLLFMMSSLMIWRHGCNHLDSNWSFCHKGWICPQTHLWLQCMYTVRRGSIYLKLTSQWRNTLANPLTVASTS